MGCMGKVRVCAVARRCVLYLCACGRAPNRRMRSQTLKRVRHKPDVVPTHPCARSLRVVEGAAALYGDGGGVGRGEFRGDTFAVKQSGAVPHRLRRNFCGV